MPAKSAVMLRVLLNRFHRSPPDALMRYLPAGEAQAVRSWDIPAVDVTPGLAKPLDQIKRIHYSWLLPVFKQLDPSLQLIMLSALPEAYQTKLNKTLKLPGSSPTKQALLPSPVQHYLLNILYSRIKPNEVLPAAFLPPTPLTQITSLNKKQLVELIDFMGLHDLAESIRHIINKHFLTKLYNCLTAKQKQFLRICLHKPEKVASTRMNLAKWNGEQQTLDTMLQWRGLVRLGKALCGQHPDFVWHLTHLLDSGRGAILLQHYTPEAVPGITLHLIQQVNSMMDFLYPTDNKNRDK